MGGSGGSGPTEGLKVNTPPWFEFKVLSDWAGEAPMPYILQEGRRGTWRLPPPPGCAAAERGGEGQA